MRSLRWTRALRALGARLLDEVDSGGGGRTGGGEHGYDEGTAMVASAMAGEREGEELERRGVVWGVRGSEGGRSTTSPGEGSGEAASRCVARAAVAVGHLPACLAGKQLAGAVLGWAGRWAGSRRQVSFFSFLSVSVFNTSATLLN